MSSDRLRQANRADAARSTGPRSRAGKAKAARNARRYGLSLPIMADAALAPEVAALARAIAGEVAGEARRAAAARIAEAQIDLTRIRRVRLAVTERLLGGAEVTGELVRIDRYERRALARRKTAIRDFQAAGWEELKLKVAK
jgi:hypothetical protein